MEFAGDGLGFSKAKVMAFPRSVLIGHGVLDSTADLLDDINIAGPSLVVTGPTTRKLAGERVAEALRKSGRRTEIIEVHGATMHDVAIVEIKTREAPPSVILGVGGGSVIDVAKLAAARARLPYVSVPTAASHDGITSPRASIKEDEGSSSKAAKAPMAIIADTEVIVRAPYRMLAAGCADAISNSTAVLDWQLAHRLRNEDYSSFAAVLSQTAADIVMENVASVKPGLEESAWLVTKALIVSGTSMSVAGSSRPASGAEHMLSHTLDKLAPGRALHGEQCGFGSILTMYLHGGDWRRIRDALRAVGAPTTADELGIPKEILVQALVQAHANKPDRYTILGDRGLARDAAERLLRETGVA
ncbi:MAG TPA: NAD(P)-dependent glycerol-1-phosphate dehydrogenase [Candidatus Thermoplasmatota archaeon]|nr:NAD(P)-dependent glycerol-1-phosphate dehydrogenase [Candidatus Thermoplasmatota archaeon]